MLVRLAEKSSEQKCGGVLVGKTDILQPVYLPSVSQKQGIQGRAFLRIDVIMVQQCVETFRCKCAFQQKDLSFVHEDMVEGIVILICDTQQFGKIPVSLEGILVVPLINDDLIDFCREMEIPLGGRRNVVCLADVVS